MTDSEIISQLRSFHQLKGWPVLREAADRLEFVVASDPSFTGCLKLHERCSDQAGSCSLCDPS